MRTRFWIVLALAAVSSQQRLARCQALIPAATGPVLLMSTPNSAEEVDRLESSIRADILDLAPIDLPGLAKRTGTFQRPFRVVSGTRKGRPLIFCLMDHATIPESVALAQAIIDRFSVRGIVYFGNAGGLKDDSSIGDVYIPKTWHFHDRGIMTEEGFTTLFENAQRDSAGGTPPPGQGAWIKPGFLERLQRVDFSRIDGWMVLAGRKPRVLFGGVGVSGNCWLDSKTRRHQLVKIFGADVVDGHAAGLMEMSQLNRIPMAAAVSVVDMAGQENSRPGESVKVGMANYYQGLFNSYLVARLLLDEAAP
ncbi:MAG: hypothetical protein HY926_09230 [Elusimicrobia bacterium]|nr:hypothetical protein [Elusimicrobiota bacterium]